MRRVFWRKRRPWVLIRFRIGGIASVPWDWTDLPIPNLGSPADNGPVALLSPAALRDLLRFSRRQVMMRPREVERTLLAVFARLRDGRRPRA